MRIILTADWQLDHTEKNAYRWEVFSWMKYLIVEENPDYIFVLGDIIDRKDKLPSAFVNDLTYHFGTLEYVSENRPILYLLPGNHDYSVRPSESILHTVAATMERGHFIATPDLMTERGWFFYPNGAEWPEDHKPTEIAFLHETVNGAKADDMKRELSSQANWAERLEGYKYVFAGDIHGHQVLTLPNKAQTKWVYVGAPHHVRFGENWEPGCVVMDWYMDADVDKWAKPRWRFVKRSDSGTPFCRKNLVFRWKAAQGAYSTDDFYRPTDEVRIHVLVKTDHLLHLSEWVDPIVDRMREYVANVDAVTWCDSGRAEQHPYKLEGQTDKEVFDAFCEQEKLEKPLIQAGEEYL